MYLGIDHSTTGVKLAIRNSERTIQTARASREKLGGWDEYQILRFIRDTVDENQIKRAAISYSYGDAISSIQEIDSVSERGVIDTVGMGYSTGGGSKVFDALASSEIPTVVLPGIHREIESLHPYFQHYSLLAGPDKYASIRAAFERFKVESESEGAYIWAGISSSVVAGLVLEGKIRGLFHWIGLVHGWPDLEEIRRIGTHGYEDIISRAGILGKRGQKISTVKGGQPEDVLQMVEWATKHNISSLIPFIDEYDNQELDAIVLTGRFLRQSGEYDLNRSLYEWGTQKASVYVIEPYASARGAALIAQDVSEGKKEILGIDVS